MMEQIGKTKRFQQFRELLKLYHTQQLLQTIKPKDEWHLLRLLELRLKIWRDFKSKDN